MSETKQIVILLIVVTLIGLAGLFLTGGTPYLKIDCNIGCYGNVYVENYRADIYLNGTLEETFVYGITESGRYRMLYRDWKVPLSQGRLGEPYVELISIYPPKGTIPYIKDWRESIWEEHGGVFSISNTQYANEISYLAMTNEAGVYMPDRFASGILRVGYLFKLHPPLECDSEYCHLNLKLADEHLPYRHFTVAVHDPDNLVSRIYIHPASDVRREGDAWVVEGVSPENTLLEVEMLLSPSVKSIMDGFPRDVPDVKGKTLSANSEYSLISGLLSAVIYALRALVLIFPVILALVYYKYGREKSYTVPKFLSYVPEHRKPWLVNLVFRKDPFDFDENGLYATLLDLHRRGVVKIETEGNKEEGLKIRPLKGYEGTEDEYEKNVLEFLRSFAAGDVFDAKAFKEQVEGLRKNAAAGNYEATSRLSLIRSRMQVLMRGARKSNADEFVMGGRKYAAKLFGLFFLLAIAMLLLFVGYGQVYPQLSFALLTSTVLVFQSVPPLFASSALFGRWKEDYYKEKLEWDAFKTFLSDFASIQKYSSEDLKIWQEWLIYGTALGVGDKVAKAMEKLNVSIPEARSLNYMPVYFGHAYSMSSPPSRGGGGFGGGGGGAR